MEPPGVGGLLGQQRYERQHRGRVRRPQDQDVRTPAQKDRDRILYTSAFRRLAGVTQVVSPSEGHVFHNRMTHTLEVAQIGRRLAEKLLQDRADARGHVNQAGGLDPDVVEAGALVHDLGHPPFGHVAESELQRLLDAHCPYLSGSFEGNAQSFRIATKLAVHRASPGDPSQNYPGLNLTRATLNAALKYPWQRGRDGLHHRKWGVYETEAGDFAWSRRGVFARGEGRALEADLMDWADDVAYSVHDLEDFYRAGLIPLDRLVAQGNSERDQFWQRYRERLHREGGADGQATDELRVVFDRLMELISTFGIAEPFDDSRLHRGYLRHMTAVFIDRYINAPHLRTPPNNDGSWAELDEALEREVRLLKALTWEYVIDGPALATQQRGQRRVIRGLFLDFARATRRREDWKTFPRPYQEELARVEDAGEDVEARRIRTVVDFIASMTEQQALRVYQRISGHAPGSILGPY